MAVLPLLMGSGCGTLQEGGAYSEHKDLYAIDQTISLSYSMIHAFVQYEYTNRAALAAYPDVKKAADRMRIGAPLWFSSPISLRDAYAATPNDGTMAALQKSLDILQAAMIEATKYMATPSKPQI